MALNQCSTAIGDWVGCTGLTSEIYGVEKLSRRKRQTPSLSLWGGSTVQLEDLSLTLNNHIGNHPFYSILTKTQRDHQRL